MISKSFDTREFSNYKSQVTASVRLDEPDRPNPLTLKVDVMIDKRKTLGVNEMSDKIFTIDDVELEFPNNAPMEAENQVEQDGFKNPYFRRRANSLVIKHQSKPLLLVVSQ